MHFKHHYGSAVQFKKKGGRLCLAGLTKGLTAFRGKQKKTKKNAAS